MERYTIAVPNTNEFEFIASVIASWDNSDIGVMHKRAALDQLLIRSEIDGYRKTKAGNIIIWDKANSNIVVHMEKCGNGLWDVCIISHNIECRVQVKEL